MGVFTIGVLRNQTEAPPNTVIQKIKISAIISKRPAVKFKPDNTIVAIRSFSNRLDNTIPIIPAGIPIKKMRVLALDPIVSNNLNRELEFITLVGVLLDIIINGMTAANVNSNQKTHK